MPLSRTLPWITIRRASYTLCAKHARNMTTSILRSISAIIKLPTGARPLRRSSSSCFCQRCATVSFVAHIASATADEAVAEDGGRTSGRVSGRYHRLKIFSLMKSPWYPRMRAFAVHRRQLRVSRYSTRLVIFSRGPYERRQRLNRFLGCQLYRRDVDEYAARDRQRGKSRSIPYEETPS